MLEWPWHESRGIDSSPKIPFRELGIEKLPSVSLNLFILRERGYRRPRKFQKEMDYATSLVGNPLSFEWKRHSFSDAEAWGAMGEPFRIDDLLDFSNDDIAGPIGYDEENTSESCLTESCESQEANYSSQFQPTGGWDPPAGELCVPSDALAELEWLSNFVEEPLITAEDVAGFDHSTCNGIPSAEEENRSASPGGREPTCKLEMLIPGRARSKRSRTGGRVWSFHGLLADPGFESRGHLSESSSSASCRTAKRPNHGRKSQDGAQARRCSHCLSQKTPQWRAGPLGPKTLCNACGVRFKSGRLLPEYRPFGSPTFSSDIHSNSHRKVLEIRRQKEQPCEENPTAELQT